MEGKVSTGFAKLQRAHHGSAPYREHGDDWMKHFISHILKITNSQWLFSTITLHDKARGTLRLKKRKDVLNEVGQLIETDPSYVPAESCFLLEFNFDSLYRLSFGNQTYRVRGIEAARRAGRRTALV